MLRDEHIVYIDNQNVAEQNLVPENNTRNFWPTLFKVLSDFPNEYGGVDVEENENNRLKRE